MLPVEFFSSSTSFRSRPSEPMMSSRPISRTTSTSFMSCEVTSTTGTRSNYPCKHPWPAFLRVGLCGLIEPGGPDSLPRICPRVPSVPSLAVFFQLAVYRFTQFRQPLASILDPIPELVHRLIIGGLSLLPHPLLHGMPSPALLHSVEIFGSIRAPGLHFPQW